MATSATRTAPPQRTGWVGWIYFAGTYMAIAGVLNIINGLVAIFNSDWVVFNSRETLLLDISGWGWVHLIIGVILLISGIGAFSGNVLARTVGVISASISLIANFLWLPTYPFWSVVVIAVDSFVIWALIVHGNELEE